MYNFQTPAPQFQELLKKKEREITQIEHQEYHLIIQKHQLEKMHPSELRFKEKQQLQQIDLQIDQLKSQRQQLYNELSIR